MQSKCFISIRVLSYYFIIFTVKAKNTLNIKTYRVFWCGVLKFIVFRWKVFFEEYSNDAP